MTTSPRNLPRFLPTLTEVVQPGAAKKEEVAATPDLENTVWFVMQRVDMVIERRLREETETMLRTVVNDQVQTLTTRLRQELEVVVRQAVSEALASKADQLKLK
ncbi:MAG: hypothetical protein WCG50_04060 [Rhodoferax sp.]|uniref:hypothetical protein n=1 Tax=Rhodoferax sp. TaxID=50421 RepID=UPI0030170307